VCVPLRKAACGFSKKLIRVSLLSLFLSPKDLALEDLALRQQLSIYAQKEPTPRMSASDKLFWVLMSRSWSRWKETLVIVKPDTVFRKS
jgi:putative transposase